MPRKVLGDRSTYLSHNDFGPLRERGDEPALLKIFPKITDFGLAYKRDSKCILIHPIQPDRCQAPEVFLGTGWSYSADIWNFGLMISIVATEFREQIFDARFQIWELLSGEPLFQAET